MYWKLKMMFICLMHAFRQKFIILNSVCHFLDKCTSISFGNTIALSLKGRKACEYGNPNILVKETYIYDSHTSQSTMSGGLQFVH